MTCDGCINRSALKERLAGDFELFRDLSDLFITESPGLMDAVEEAVRSGNGGKISKSAHTLKGAVSNFYAERAFAAALALERIGKNNETEMAPAACRTLVREIENLREALKSILREGNL